MKFPENITDEQVDKARKIFFDDLLEPVAISNCSKEHHDRYKVGYLSSELITMLEDDSLLQRNRKRYEEILQAVVDGDVSQ